MRRKAKAPRRCLSSVVAVRAQVLEVIPAWCTNISSKSSRGRRCTYRVSPRLDRAGSAGVKNRFCQSVATKSMRRALSSVTSAVFDSELISRAVEAPVRASRRLSLGRRVSSASGCLELKDGSAPSEYTADARQAHHFVAQQARVHEGR